MGVHNGLKDPDIVGASVPIFTPKTVGVAVLPKEAVAAAPSGGILIGFDPGTPDAKGFVMDIPSARDVARQILDACNSCSIILRP